MTNQSADSLKKRMQSLLQEFVALRTQKIAEFTKGEDTEAAIDLARHWRNLYILYTNNKANVQKFYDAFKNEPLDSLLQQTSHNKNVYDAFDTKYKLCIPVYEIVLGYDEVLAALKEAGKNVADLESYTPNSPNFQWLRDIPSSNCTTGVPCLESINQNPQAHTEALAVVGTMYPILKKAVDTYKHLTTLQTTKKNFDNIPQEHKDAVNAQLAATQALRSQTKLYYDNIKTATGSSDLINYYLLFDVSNQIATLKNAVTQEIANASTLKNKLAGIKIGSDNVAKLLSNELADIDGNLNAVNLEIIGIDSLLQKYSTQLKAYGDKVKEYSKLIKNGRVGIQWDKKSNSETPLNPAQLTYGSNTTPNAITNQDFSTTPLTDTGDGDTHELALDDVNQGGLGDCFFLSAVGGVAKDYPNELKKNIVGKTIQDPKGNSVQIYEVTLHLPNEKGELKPVVVEVLPTFPTLNGQPIHADSNTEPSANNPQATENEIWVMVLEKAMATVHNNIPKKNTGYESINKGGHTTDALPMLLGGSYAAAAKTISSFNNQKEFYGLLNDPACKTFALATDKTINGQTPSITKYVAIDATRVVYPTHQYMLESFDSSKDIVTLFNPHNTDITDANGNALIGGKAIAFSFKEIQTYFSQITFSKKK